MSPLSDPTSPFRSPARRLPSRSRTSRSRTRRVGPAVGTTDPAIVSALAAGGIPATALDAYRRAAAAANPACGITWPLLAAIGRVESNHGRFAGATLHSDGLSTPPIIGIRLDGSRSVVVRDTDGGRLDGDPTYDHAVGPMQFIPSTWAVYRADGNGDGRYDPFNIYDAAAATASYLCQAGGNLRTGAGQQRAVWSYNPSTTLCVRGARSRGRICRGCRHRGSSTASRNSAAAAAGPAAGEPGASARGEPVGSRRRAARIKESDR